MWIGFELTEMSKFNEYQCNFNIFAIAPKSIFKNSLICNSNLIKNRWNDQN